MISLEDVCPERPEFTLRKTGKTYRLRPVMLQDHVWFQRNYGEGFYRAFLERDWKEICKIAYYLLDDRSEFPATDATLINEVGETTKVRLSGPELLYHNVGAEDEGVSIIAAINSAFANSGPKVREAIHDSIKKKIARLQTGESSSIFSPQSTDGQPNTSLREQLEKSNGDLNQSSSDETSRPPARPLCTA